MPRRCRPAPRRSAITSRRCPSSRAASPSSASWPTTPRASALQADLKPGQQLVTRDGAVWRWDGYTMRAGAPSTAAVRLSQRNRLAEIRQQIDAVAAEHETAQARVEAEAGCAGRGPRCREDLRRAGARARARGGRRGAAQVGGCGRSDPRRRAHGAGHHRHGRARRGRGARPSHRRGAPHRSAAHAAQRHRAGGGRDRGRHRRRRDAPHLPPGAPVVDLRYPGRPRGRGRAARAHRRTAGGAGRGRRQLRSPGPRGRHAASSASARSRRTMPAGATAWPMPRARSSSSMRGANRSRR